MVGPVPYWLLGLLALGIVWVTALLCALAATDTARALGKKAEALASRLREGEVLSGLGGPDDDRAFATHEVVQIGRALDAAPGASPGIAFSDKSHGGVVHGGVLRSQGSELSFGPSEALSPWPAAEAQAAAARREADASFDAVYKEARSGKGSPRVVRTVIGEGARVWFATEGSALTFLSATDPLAWYRRKRSGLFLFALAELGVCGALTALALVPPAFGGASTIGGALLLLFFLLVQPLGVSLDEGAREPHCAFLRGEWRRSAPFAAGAVPGRASTRIVPTNQA